MCTPPHVYNSNWLFIPPEQLNRSPIQRFSLHFNWNMCLVKLHLIVITSPFLACQEFGSRGMFGHPMAGTNNIIIQPITRKKSASWELPRNSFLTCFLIIAVPRFLTATKIKSEFQKGPILGISKHPEIHNLENNCYFKFMQFHLMFAKSMVVNAKSVSSRRIFWQNSFSTFSIMNWLIFHYPEIKLRRHYTSQVFIWRL